MTADLNAMPDNESPEFDLPGLRDALPVLIAEARRKQTLVRKGLRHLYDRLVDPLPMDDSAYVPTDGFDVAIAKRGGAEADLASAMLDWGYCSHYYTGEGEPELPPEPPILRSRAYTLVASAYVGDTAVVLGTIQVIVGPTVPALSLFCAGVGRGAGHAPESGPEGYSTVGELRRLAVSPLFEVSTDDQALGIAVRSFRQGVYRALHKRALALFREEGVTAIYTIVTPETSRFVTRAGTQLRSVAGARLNDTVELRQLQGCFAHYWRPSAPAEQRPGLFEVLCQSDELAFA